MKKKYCFFAVDCQKDFMNPDGKLYIKDAELLKPNLAKLTKFAAKNRFPVISTGDYHTAETKEFSETPDFVKTFPFHCLASDSGSDFIEEVSPQLNDNHYYLNSWNQAGVEILKLWRARNIIIYKDTFDVFLGNINAETIIENFKDHTAVVYGVAGDYCVDFVVKGLVERGFDVLVVIDAIKEISKESMSRVLDFWIEIGINFVTTNEIIS